MGAGSLGEEKLSLLPTEGSGVAAGRRGGAPAAAESRAAIAAATDATEVFSSVSGDARSGSASPSGLRGRVPGVAAASPAGPAMPEAAAFWGGAPASPGAASGFRIGVASDMARDLL